MFSIDIIFFKSWKKRLFDHNSTLYKILYNYNNIVHQNNLKYHEDIVFQKYFLYKKNAGKSQHFIRDVKLKNLYHKYEDLARKFFFLVNQIDLQNVEYFHLKRQYQTLLHHEYR